MNLVFDLGDEIKVVNLEEYEKTNTKKKHGSKDELQDWIDIYGYSDLGDHARYELLQLIGLKDEYGYLQTNIDILNEYLEANYNAKIISRYVIYNEKVKLFWNVIDLD